MKVIGYRDVPVDTQALAEHVASTMPYVQQVFVDLNQHETPVKQLYLARKQIEQYAEREHLDLYFTSLSHKTIVYKGWLRSDRIKTLYLDLNNEDYQSKLGLVHSRFSTNTFLVGNMHILTDFLCITEKLIRLKVMLTGCVLVNVNLLILYLVMKVKNSKYC